MGRQARRWCRGRGSSGRVLDIAVVPPGAVLRSTPCPLVSQPDRSRFIPPSTHDTHPVLALARTTSRTSMSACPNGD